MQIGKARQLKQMIIFHDSHANNINLEAIEKETVRGIITSNL